jgi:hypothetical protein
MVEGNKVRGKKIKKKRRRNNNEGGEKTATSILNHLTADT